MCVYENKKACVLAHTSKTPKYCLKFLSLFSHMTEARIIFYEPTLTKNSILGTVSITAIDLVINIQYPTME